MEVGTRRTLGRRETRTPHEVGRDKTTVEVFVSDPENSSRFVVIVVSCVNTLCSYLDFMVVRSLSVNDVKVVMVTTIGLKFTTVKRPLLMVKEL